MDLIDGITLCPADHDDMTRIVKDLIPNAPKFAALFHSQVKNAECADPWQRKWDTAIISLALNIYAKYDYKIY